VRAVTFTGAGGNEVVAVRERTDPVPASGEVLVAVRFAGVNWADVAQRQGSYLPPPGAPQDIPGLEVAGVVTATGTGVRAWRPGDRVFGLVGGGELADRVAVHERHVAAIPGNLADDVAAAVRRRTSPLTTPCSPSAGCRWARRCWSTAPTVPSKILLDFG